MSYHQLKNKRVLVTGGAGFIGSNICDELLKQGSIVTVLDNLSSGDESNIAHLMDNPNFTFVQGDLRDKETCIQVTKDADLVCHQAAKGSVPASIDNPLATFDINVQGTINLFWACAQAKVKRVVFASSSSVYGDNEAPIKMEGEEGEQLSPYAVSKYTNELCAHNFAKIYDFNFVGLRYFNVYGQRQSPEGAYAAVIPKFLDQLLEGNACTINGDGSFSRDFTHVENVVHANLRALTTDNSETLNQIYNIACGTRLSIKELYDHLRDEVATMNPNVKDLEPIFGPQKQGDIPHSLASVEKAKAKLGYEILVGIEDGLKRTTQWYVQSTTKYNRKELRI